MFHNMLQLAYAAPKILGILFGEALSETNKRVVQNGVTLRVLWVIATGDFVRFAV